MSVYLYIINMLFTLLVLKMKKMFTFSVLQLSTKGLEFSMLHSVAKVL